MCLATIIVLKFVRSKRMHSFFVLISSFRDLVRMVYFGSCLCLYEAATVLTPVKVGRKISHTVLILTGILPLSSVMFLFQIAL